jgi:hypothetical protein
VNFVGDLLDTDLGIGNGLIKAVSGAYELRDGSVGGKTILFLGI